MKWTQTLFAAVSAAIFSAGLAFAESATPRVIKITGDDTMKFSVTQIEAKPGESLEVEFSNMGQVPKQAMGHNWVLLKQMNDKEIAAFAASAMPKAPDYIPDDTSAIIAHTKTLGPKETDKVVFNAPTTPGEYPFICTFPGHYTLMHGKLVVK